MVLVTCVPCEFWSCSHLFGCSDTLVPPAPPPPNDLAYCTAMRSWGKYRRQVSSSPVSRTPMYTPLPSNGTARAEVSGADITLIASRSHVLNPFAKLVTATPSNG